MENQGGRLKDHLKQWKSICQNKYIWKVIGDGLDLETKGRPPTFKLRRAGQSHQEELERIIREYLSRGVIKEVCSTGQSTYPFFLIQQGEKLRPILDLRPLNKFLKYRHFKMEGIQTARSMVRERDWFCKIDLKDAYQAVPMSSKARQHLGFELNGKTYQFQVMPFGLSSAPRTFTKLMTTALRPLREAGIRLSFYLDDVLILGSSQDEARKAAATVATHLEGLGFTINRKKSLMTPTQEINFLGMTLDSKKMSISVPSEKVRKLKAELRRAMSATKIKMRKLAALAGLLTATAAGFEPCYIHQRYIQANIILFQRRGLTWDQSIPILKRSRTEIQWWLEKLEKLNGRSLLETESQISVFTDASLSGWGYCSDSFSGAGFWNEKDRGESSNFRELKSVYLMLREERKKLRGKHVILRSDNTTTISQIARQSNPRHPKLIRLAKKIWQILIQERIKIKVVHVRGVENTEADLLSRLSMHDWKLDPTVFRRIERRYGTVSMDLFACHVNAQTKEFCSYHDCPGATAVDAFSLRRWPENAFANPPPILINRVLQFSARQPHKLILLTPTWPSQAWWAECRQRAMRRPISIRVKKQTATIRGRSCSIPYESLTVWQLSPSF